MIELSCAKHVDLDRAALSIGTLGGGNHFIELDKDYVGKLYLVVHSGSRNLGKQVCDYYQKTAAKQSITLTQYENAMKGVYANIGDTAEVIKRIEPLYNFKAEDHV